MGTNKELFIRLLCELFASFFVQFFGCVFSQFYGTIAHALTWGCAVVAATHAFRIISGAHINPCITIAAMILQVINVAEGFLYICFQMIGSAIGFGVAYGILDGTAYRGSTFCVAVVELTPWWKSLLLEIFMTGAWVFAMCATWQRENINLLETVSLRIGLVVAICHLVGGAQTGCSMNPFRALWPAVAANYWQYAYIPIAVPIATAIVLALAWRFFYVWGRYYKYNEDYYE